MSPKTQAWRRSVDRPRTPVGFHTNWAGQLAAWLGRQAEDAQAPLPHHWTTFTGVPRCAVCGVAQRELSKSARPPYACKAHLILVEAALAG